MRWTEFMRIMLEMLGENHDKLLKMVDLIQMQK